MAEGKVPPLPTSLDHLRMIVAADRLKLRESEMIILEKVALSYPMSQTIREHGVATIYRLNGDTKEIVNFPFDIATNGHEWFAKFCAWWLEMKTQSLQNELAIRDANRIERARKLASRIATNVLPKMEGWRDIVEKENKFPDIVTRLKTAIEEFKKIAPTQPARVQPPENSKKKGSQVGEGEGEW
jgi:hypothetical protein